MRNVNIFSKCHLLMMNSCSLKGISLAQSKPYLLVNEGHMNHWVMDQQFQVWTVTNVGAVGILFHSEIDQFYLAYDRIADYI